MAKSKESGLTTTLKRSLIRAGLVSAHKIQDMPHFKGQKTLYDVPKPCDIMAVLPGGRALSIEVKQQAPNAKGEALGFSATALAPHQKLHLAHVHELGGCAVVALVSWRPQKPGQKGFWRLYLWTWDEFLALTNDGKESIPAERMRTLPYLDRKTPSQVAAYWGLPKEATPKAPEWSLDGHVNEWGQRLPEYGAFPTLQGAPMSNTDKGTRTHNGVEDSTETLISRPRTDERDTTIANHMIAWGQLSEAAQVLGLDDLGHMGADWADRCQRTLYALDKEPDNAER